MILLERMDIEDVVFVSIPIVEGDTMRKPEYLSPSSISKFIKSPLEFYKDYLADNRQPKYPQTGAMSVGSGFDAFVKCELVKALYGEASGRFDLETMLNKSVSPGNLEFARNSGAHCLEEYKRSGAFSDLLIEMQQSVLKPRFEFTDQKVVDDGVMGNVQGVPLLGKPDSDFVDSGNNKVILDWKVNSYCSKSGASPAKGYALCRDPDGTRYSHKDFISSTGKGLRYNTAMCLEDVNEDWGRQLCIYGWLSGQPVGSRFLCAIEQLACAPGKNNNIPSIRCVSHRAFVSEKFQKDLFTQALGIWNIIQSGWIFREMSEDASRKLQESLDRGVVQDDKSNFFEEAMRPKY